MSVRDIDSAYKSSLAPATGNPTVQVVPNVEAGKHILESGGETLNADEIKKMVGIFKAEIAKPETDGEVSAWMQEQLSTIDTLQRYVPQVSELVKSDAPKQLQMIKLMMKEGTRTLSIAGQMGERYGISIPDEIKYTAEATKSIINKAIANGATPMDARALEDGQLGIDHGSIMPKGKFQRYPQWRSLEKIFARSNQLESNSRLQPKQQPRLDGLDPRVTTLNGAIAEKMVRTKQAFNVERPDGSGFKLDPVSRTWAEHAATDRDPDAVTEEYDEKPHPDHLAWADGDGPFASNFMIWADGTVQLLRAPRRTLVEDEISMAGGLLTTGALGRGMSGWAWGHFHADILDMPKDPNDPRSEKVPMLVATQVGLSGFVCGEIADGRLKLPDPVDLVKAQGIRVQDGLQVYLENAEHAAKIWKNPATGLLEKKP